MPKLHKILALVVLMSVCMMTIPLDARYRVASATTSTRTSTANATAAVGNDTINVDNDTINQSANVIAQPQADSFTKIATGSSGSTTCALTSSSAAYCWGSNYYGQLGNGTTTNSNRPVAVTMPTGVTFSAIAVGVYQSCALSTTGSAYCWGANSAGELGTGTTTASNVPMAVTMPAGVTFTAIVAANSLSCALATTGTVYCWGIAPHGTSYTPLAVNMQGVSVTTIAAGWSNICALTASGAAYCWGFNTVGQIGDGTTTYRSNPVAVTRPSGVSFKAISSGSDHTCAITTTNTAYCWGKNSNGSLGNGTTTNSTTPVAVTMPTGVSFTSIKVGYIFTCALTTTGTAYCWGYSNNGQLGNGTTNSSTTPVAVTMPTGVSFSAISNGWNVTCALATTGTAYCWGENQGGQLGVCDSLIHNVPTLVGFAYCPPSTSTPTQTSTRTSTPTRTATVTRTSTRTNTLTNTRTSTRTATLVPGSNPWGNFTAITAGYSASCALNSAGKAYCWGSNQSGALGNGTTTNSNAPVAVTMPTGVTFASIGAGVMHSCALTTTGTVYCWGYNYDGKLGNGTTTDSSIPVAVTMPDGVTFTALSVGQYHNCALATTGAAYCWGSSVTMQLGNNT